MKKPQWIAITVSVLLVTAIYTFGKIVPPGKKAVNENQAHTEDDGHGHGQTSYSIDSVLTAAKTRLTPQQTIRINTLENSISRGAVKEQQLNVYHQLSHFWADTVKFFEPYAWYEAEAARLENSEKTLTFAAHLFLENLQRDNNVERIKWKALQAKDLFERSLKINPGNDSSRVGLGACYLFGNISHNPMEGISKIREVTNRDSANVYANLVLAKGSLISNQLDKAVERLQVVVRHQPSNLEAILILADVYEKMNKKDEAVFWYQKSLEYIKMEEIRKEIEKRINELRS